MAANNFDDVYGMLSGKGGWEDLMGWIMGLMDKRNYISEGQTLQNVKPAEMKTTEGYISEEKDAWDYVPVVQLFTSDNPLTYNPGYTDVTKGEEWVDYGEDDSIRESETLEDQWLDPSKFDYGSGNLESIIDSYSGAMNDHELLGEGRYGEDANIPGYENTKTSRYDDPGTGNYTTENEWNRTGGQDFRFGDQDVIGEDIMLFIKDFLASMPNMGRFDRLRDIGKGQTKSKIKQTSQDIGDVQFGISQDVLKDVKGLRKKHPNLASGLYQNIFSSMLSEGVGGAEDVRRKGMSDIFTSRIGQQMSDEGYERSFLSDVDRIIAEMLG